MRADVLDGVLPCGKACFIYDTTCGKRYSLRAWSQKWQVMGHDEGWFGKDQRYLSLVPYEAGEW